MIEALCGTGSEAPKLLISDFRKNHGEVGSSALFRGNFSTMKPGNAQQEAHGHTKNNKAEGAPSITPYRDEELVNRYQQKAYAMAYHLCSENAEEAEDVTQEAFLRAFRSLSHFRGESSFYTWFYRILVNLCLDRKRYWSRWHRVFKPWHNPQDMSGTSEKVYEEALNPTQNESAADILRHKQLSRDIRKSLRRLPEKQRIAFQLKVLHGMGIREIAQVMGSAEGTVKSHLFRATHSLREALKEWDQP